ncbi:RuBisCO large subunit C-terminal-like domain-containing protein [Fodinibius halophilus]|uniref:Ribulose 1,5-bisphosphate carboxylase n=1 Tax=Fodinibius halophilus TaxID=1736908 RepID=A0A6M1T9A5_9BACT|nr:RuBisCO large subunit C-terminal-like domain-containing protein [Fodinibius halophilus]NGP87614.1 ribulose 1,5-bisphosphate carboxylase [Fodinibius halophilus]
MIVERGRYGPFFSYTNKEYDTSGISTVHPKQFRMSAFEITYLLTLSDGEDIDQKVKSICLEQSVELPGALLDSHIEEEVVGDPVSIEKVKEDQFEVVISWPIANLGGEITQFINVLYGNISLKPGIRVTSADWTELSDLFAGPAVGLKEVRNRHQVLDRPLSATALKPVGSTPSELANYCFQFACGGIDIIKDDHGLANQSAAPFGARLKACVSAISKAEEQTGNRASYYPNITASPEEAIERYQMAARRGADGVLLCPHISGLPTMHKLAQMDIDLPIIAHPAFSGQLVMHETNGFTPDFLYGQLWRAFGADFIIYPNKGGRFSFTTEQCKAINGAARTPDSDFKKSFPMPGGGMEIDDLDRWVADYGKDTVFLIGGSLYEHPEGIIKGAQELQDKLTRE